VTATKSILADAHSKDRTREIAKKYNAIVLDDNGKNMEEGKRLALGHATGDYIVFVDADNEISHPDYIELAHQVAGRQPAGVGCGGVLSAVQQDEFVLRVSFPSIAHQRSDCLVDEPESSARGRNGEVERWTLKGESLAYPLGANGFAFRRADLTSVKAGEHFQDTHAALHLDARGKTGMASHPRTGRPPLLRADTLGFCKKRRRATVHFLQVQEEMPVNWMKEKPPVPIWLAALVLRYVCRTDLSHVIGVARDKDARWLWHVPPVSEAFGVMCGV